ncbi:JmjC domain-containing protein [Photorhabdus caribbeanensis]|nr:cupin domain-containing protein [Photorhabdus caribbeanensis]
MIEDKINGSHLEEIDIKDYIFRIKNGIKNLGNWSWQPFYTYPDLNTSYILPEHTEIKNISLSLVGQLAICPWLLMSSKGTITNMHQDMMNVNGVVGQLEGIKEFILVPPEFKLEEGKFYHEDELAILNIPYYIVRLEKGDFIYFPQKWWHQARTIEASVTFIHSTVNEHNLKMFLDDIVTSMPQFIQRLQFGAKKKKYFGSKIFWLSNGFKKIG